MVTATFSNWELALHRQTLRPLAPSKYNSHINFHYLKRKCQIQRVKKRLRSLLRKGNGLIWKTTCSCWTKNWILSSTTNLHNFRLSLNCWPALKVWAAYQASRLFPVMELQIQWGFWSSVIVRLNCLRRVFLLRSCKFFWQTSRSSCGYWKQLFQSGQIWGEYVSLAFLRVFTWIFQREKFTAQNTVMCEDDANRIMAIETSILNDKRSANDRQPRINWINFLKRYIFQFFNVVRPLMSTGSYASAWTILPINPFVLCADSKKDTDDRISAVAFALKKHFYGDTKSMCHTVFHGDTGTHLAQTYTFKITSKCKTEIVWTSPGFLTH